MRLLVNDELTVLSIGPRQTLRQIAQAICPSTAKDPSLVVSVRCNGREMAEEHLELALEKPILDFDEVAFQTLPLKALVAQNLSGAGELVAAAGASSTEAADRISSGKEQEALEKLQQFFSQWRSVQESFVLCMQAMNLSFEEIEAQGLPIRNTVERSRTTLVELKTLLETGDMVLIGDILRFELEEVFNLWNQIIDWMKSRLDRNLLTNSTHAQIASTC